MIFMIISNKSVRRILFYSLLLVFDWNIPREESLILSLS